MALWLQSHTSFMYILLKRKNLLVVQKNVHTAMRKKLILRGRFCLETLYIPPQPVKIKLVDYKHLYIQGMQQQKMQGQESFGGEL